MNVGDIIKALAGIDSNPRVIRELGAELARGMQQGGNARSYSSMNPAGHDTSAGVAGGRGASSGSAHRSEADFIKSEQLRTEVNRKVFNSYKLLNKRLDSTSKSLDDVQSDLTTFAKVFTHSWEDAMDSVEKSWRSQDKLIANLNALGYEDIKTTEDLLELREKQQKLEQKLLNAKGIERLALQQEYQDYKKLSKAMNEATTNIDSTVDKLKGYLSDTGKAFFSLENVTLQLGITFTRLMGDIGASMKFGSRTTLKGVWEDQVDALRAGMDPAAFAEMTAQARQASYQFDSMGQFSDELITRQREYYGYIGDSAEAAQFATNSFNTLGRAGIDPTSKAFDHLGQTFLYLNKAAGVSAEQFNQMQETLLADENIQTRLRAANVKERAAILAGINNRLKENVAIGMSTEKSLEAARAMGRIAGGDAKERFKQAAMAQMTLGSMGIGGGERAAELIRKGQRMDDTERKELQGIMGKASQFMAETKTGALGSELAFGTIMQKSGLEQYMGPSSPFNITLEKQLAIDAEANARIITELQEGPGILSDAKYWSDIFKNGIMESPIISLLTAIGAGVGLIAMRRGIGGMMGRFAGKGGFMGRMAGMFGGGGGAAATTGAATAGAGGLAALGATSVGAAGAGAIAGTVGVGLAAGGLIGTAMNNFAKLWGGRQLSTTILDAFTDFNDYDPNEDYKHLMKNADNTEQIIEPAKQTAEAAVKSLTEAQKTNVLLTLLVETEVGAVGKVKALDRINNLQNGMQASTV